MKPDNHTFEDGFESWVRAKQYADLNSDELQILRSEGIDEAAYAEIRTMLLALDTMEPEPVEKASDAIKDNLMEAFDRGPKKDHRRGLIFWIGGIGLAAAAAMLLFFYVLPGPQGGKNEMVVKQPTESNEEQPRIESAEMNQGQATATEIEQAENEVVPNANAPIQEDVGYEELHDVKVQCPGPPDVADVPATAESLADIRPTSGSNTGSTVPPLSTTTRMEEDEPLAKTKLVGANNQQLTTAMIDWLVTVY